MNGEFEMCLKCFHVWEHEDDRCPDCGHDITEEFDPKVKLKQQAQQIKELERDGDDQYLQHYQNIIKRWKEANEH